MTKEAIEAAAHALAAARTERRQIDRLPAACRPGTDEDALAIQQRIVQLLRDQIGGWKCAVPRDDHVFLAPLLASTIRSGSRCSVVSHNGLARIEPEVAFILGKDLSPRAASYAENDLRNAIAEARLVLEIIGSRLVDPTAVPFVEFLADSINNQGLLVGPPVSNPFERQLETLRITVSLLRALDHDQGGTDRSSAAAPLWLAIPVKPRRDIEQGPLSLGLVWRILKFRSILRYRCPMEIWDN
jgi:2-keto-4-pentenoate hydratase